MKSYTTWILCFSVAVYCNVMAVLLYLWWLLLIGGAFWCAGLWGFYFTEKSNIARYHILERAYKREKEHAQVDRLEEIKAHEKNLYADKRKNVRTGAYVDLDELKRIQKE